jgi:hypothetical protein
MNNLGNEHIKAITPGCLEDALFQIENLSRVVAIAMESRLDKSEAADRDMTAITCIIRNVNDMAVAAIDLHVTETNAREKELPGAGAE